MESVNQNSEGKIRIKPLIKSDFVPDLNTSGTFRDDLKMSLVIKVGDIYGTLYLHCGKNDEGEYICNHSLYGFSGISSVIDVDVDDIVKRYLENAEGWKLQIQSQKLKVKKQQWESSWVHELYEIVKSKRIPGLELIFPSLEEFQNSYVTQLNCFLTYKNKKLSVERERVTGGWSFRIPSYAFNTQRDARYTSVDNYINKFIFYVNESISKEAASKLALEKKSNLVLETVKRYTELFGNCTHEEKIHFQEFGPRDNRRYTIDEYYISVSRTNSAGSDVTQKYKVSENSDKTFNFAGLNYLSPEKIIKMLAILNDD